ncbi:MAG: hypothetical protein ACREJ7_08635 [Candidatus Methylomirabilales bacterium]
MQAAVVIAMMAIVTMIPAMIVRHKTEKVVYWWFATIATGFFPALIASLLHRYRGTPPMPAFFWGIGVSIGVGVVIAYLAGAL